MDQRPESGVLTPFGAVAPVRFAMLRSTPQEKKVNPGLADLRQRRLVMVFRRAKLWIVACVCTFALLAPAFAWATEGSGADQGEHGVKIDPTG